MRSMVVIIVILLSSTKISTTHGSNECNPSRCGDQYIGHPFTLKDDPSNCNGDENYKLSCIGTKTFMAAPYDKYLVTSIFYDNNSINIVDMELASGKCRLPSQAITPTFFPKGFYFTEYWWWTGFINCSENLDNNLPAAAIPCLSQKNKFIYAIPFAMVNSSHVVSCTYLTMVPTMLSGVDFYNGGDGIFGIMKNGFALSWSTREEIPRSKIIHHCLTQAVSLARKHTNWSEYFARLKYLFQFEFEFRNCIQENWDSTAYGYLIAIVVLIGFIFLYLVIITLGRLTVAPLCIFVFLLYELLKMLSPINNIEKFLRNQQRATLTRYGYADIIAMTSHFKDRLGQGGFGTVYKGELPGGYFVAVKLLGKSNDNGEDFINEVSTIGTIHHTNIVRLTGFCSEGLHRALVYEYMYNGSLDKYIFSSTRKFTITKLNEIAIGVARGIDYLHRGCDMRILHFDIKPHNILLDSNFSPKVSDFGLAKLYSRDNSLVSTFAARGTIGYMAPELISRSFGPISYKSDVYSFGMLLLEMAAGRRNYDSRAENSCEAYYPSWIYDRLNKTTNLEVLDHKIEPTDIEVKLCKVGLWCIQMSPSSRPTMQRVLEMLEGDVTDVEMPPKPFFFCSSDHSTMGHNSFHMCSNEISTIHESE